jgi:hypothetical protein
MRLAFLRSCLFLAVAAWFAPGLVAQNYQFSTLVGNVGATDVWNRPGGTLFTNACGLAVDGAGNLYVADSGHYAIRKVTPAGVVSTVAGGEQGLLDGPAGQARFDFPFGIAVDAAGTIYVSEVNRHVIRKITPDGTVSTLAGMADAAGSTDGTGAAARFNRPGDLAVDAAGNLYVSDYNNYVIRKITPAGAVTTFAGTASAFPGHLDGPRGVAAFANLGALAFDAAGNLFVADNWACVRKIAPDGTVSTLAGTYPSGGNLDATGAEARFSNITGLAVEASGSILVADANQTLRRISSSGAVTTLAGRGSQRAVSDGSGGTAGFKDPGSLVVARTGTVYLLDEYRTIIRQGAPVTGQVAPVLVSQTTENANIGAGATVSFSATFSAAATATFQWMKNGAPVAGATNSSLTITAATPADEGSYAVVASNSVASIWSLPVTLRVFLPSLASFTPRRATTGGSFLWSIASGAGRLVTVGTGGKILTSVDGRTWTESASGTTDWLVGVTYGAGWYVAVGDHGTILLSRDALTWTKAVSSGTTQRLNNVLYAVGVFVAVGEGGTIVTSRDAQTWTARPTGVTGWLRGLSYAASVTSARSRFHAGGENGALLFSFDGENWGQDTINWAAQGGPRDIEAFTGNIGIGQSGAIISFSEAALYPKFPAPDGKREPFYIGGWYPLATGTGTTARIRGLAQGAEALFATGENGLIIAAPNAVGPWTVLPSQTTANLVSGVFHGNSLFIVGENETILQSQSLYTSRLINISTRGVVSGGDKAMISGFVVTGSTSKRILLRAAGPALATFGVANTLTAPVLTLFDSANRSVASNTRWGTAGNAAGIDAAAASVGAFPFAAGSADSALLVTLPPGAYTAQVSGAAGVSGVSLVEAYDVDTLSNEGSRAINISTRGQVGLGADNLIAGFVINGAASRRVLIRAVGPGLSQFGLTGLLPAPQIQLYDSRGALRITVVASPAAVNTEARDAAVIAGAFALPDLNSDAAFVTTLLPGSYTVKISGLNDTTGLALVEVYDLP